MAAMDRPFSNVLEGSGTVEKVQLANTEGISFEFDSSAYIEPGADRPVRPVSVTVDATRFRSIEGICDVKRDRYFRYYAAPNADRSGMEPYFKEKGFLPGRQIEEIGPAYEDRWGAADRMPHLTEDPQRTGYGNPSFFERREFDRFEGVDPDLEFIMCFDAWPRFMWPTNLPGVSNQRGTPAPEHFDAAADTAVRLLNAQVRDSGRSATWWEVKNESDVKSEWIYHHEPGYDGWKLLADFHNTVADAVHSNVPGVQIGGPASAWLEPHRGEFEVWEKHRQFMDQTRDHLDFYSLHFYEMGSMDSEETWRSGSDSYIQGGLECTVDMLRAHMGATGNIKPLVCSEYGSLNVKRDERGWWMHMKNINAMLVHLLNRPGDFEITVPFLLSFMHWAPDSSETFIHQAPSGEFIKTKNTYWLDQWEGFKGKRIPVSTSDSKIFTVAVLDENLIRLVVNNSTGQRILVDVDTVLPDGVAVLSVKRRMPCFEQGKTLYVHDVLPDLKQIPLGVDVTCILEIQLDQVPDINLIFDETSHYARQTAVKVDGSATLDIPVSGDHSVAEAVLRVGLYRAGGFSKPVFIALNGAERHAVDLSWSEGIPQFLDFIEMPICPENISAENRVVIEIPESGGTVTAAKIITVSE
jgi:agarase